jgi:hypothetical protein
VDAFDLGRCNAGQASLQAGDVGQSRAKVVQHSDKVRQDLRPAGGGVWVVRRAPTFLGERSGLGTNNGHAGEKPGDLPVQQVTRVELIIFSTLQRTRLSSSTVDAHNTTVQSCRFVARTQNSNSEQFRFVPRTCLSNQCRLMGAAAMEGLARAPNCISHG